MKLLRINFVTSPHFWQFVADLIYIYNYTDIAVYIVDILLWFSAFHAFEFRKTVQTFLLLVVGVV